MKVERFNPEKHYEAAKAYWTAHSWPVMPLTALPRLGLTVAKEGGEPLCFGWLYRTDSSFAWLEWVVADKESDKLERGEALDLLISSLTTEARKLGHTIIFTTVKHPKLIERYKAHGFIETDKDMTNMVKGVS